MTNTENTMSIAKKLGMELHLTPEETARILRKSTEWLQLQRSRGMGPSYSRLGSAKNSPILYALIDVIEYVDACRIRTA